MAVQHHVDPATPDTHQRNQSTTAEVSRGKDPIGAVLLIPLLQELLHRVLPGRSVSDARLLCQCLGLLGIAEESAERGLHLLNQLRVPRDREVTVGDHRQQVDREEHCSARVLRHEGSRRVLSDILLVLFHDGHHVAELDRAHGKHRRLAVPLVSEVCNVRRLNEHGLRVRCGPVRRLLSHKLSESVLRVVRLGTRVQDDSSTAADNVRQVGRSTIKVQFSSGLDVAVDVHVYDVERCDRVPAVLLRRAQAIARE